MNDTSFPPDDVEDLGECIRSGRPVRQARAYRILHADEALDFKPALIEDPVPTARQILKAIGLEPVDEFVLCAVLPDRSYETLRPDETFDVRGRGSERFVHFRSDRTFRFTLDDRAIEWGAPTISGRQLKLAAGVDPATYDVYLDVRGGHDRLIGNDEILRLDAPGVERFVTLIRHTTEGAALLPERDRRYLENAGYAHEVISEGGMVGVILKGFHLPEGKFDQTRADALILLPLGYPDAQPDMFYLDPWVKLAASGAYPRAANVPQTFAGRNWQRWSRHALPGAPWRPGVDGIHTMVNRALNAMREAA